MRKWHVCLTAVVCFAFSCLAQTNVTLSEVDADFLMVQMRYAEAADIYSEIKPSSEVLTLKKGVARFLSGDFSSCRATLEPLSVNTNSAFREEALFYCLSSKLKVAEQENFFSYSDGSSLDYTHMVFAGLVSDESKAFRNLLLSQILEHLLASQSDNTKDAMLGAVELVEEQLRLLGQADPRTKMLWIKFRYFQKDYRLVSKTADELFASGADIDIDPFLYPCFKYLSQSLYEIGREENVFLEGSGYVPEFSVRADLALHYGVKYLRLRPDDEEFADWLSSKVLMSLFFQTKNPGYLVDIIELGQPSGNQVKEIYKLAKGVLRFGERRQIFSKADTLLSDTAFASEYWNRRGRIELMGRDMLLAQNGADFTAIQSVMTQNNGRVPILLGGAMYMQSKQELISKYALLHNNNAVRNKVVNLIFASGANHGLLSKELFGQDMSVVHKFIDANKSGGSLHRMFSGHDLKWLLNNLDEMANLTLNNGSRLGKKKAALVWIQHVGQDLFSIKGVPTPITKPVFAGAKLYARIVLGKSSFGAHKFATKIAAKTCLNAAKAVNIAMWGYVAYEIYDAFQDFAAGQDIADAKKDVQSALIYGDFGRCCDMLERQLSGERIKERMAAETLALQITLARLQAINEDSSSCRKTLNEVVKTCRDMKWELKEGSDVDGDLDIEDQAEDLEKIPRKIQEVLIHDSTFNADVSCEAYAHEAMLLVTSDTDIQSVLGNAIGVYETTGDKLLKQSKEGARVVIAWSAAVNFYRAARLAQTFNHQHASRLAGKSVDTLFQMRKEPGVLSVKLLDKIRNNWLLEFGMVEQAENMDEIRIFKENVPKQIDWRELHFRKLTMHPNLLANKGDLVVELVRRSNGIEATLLREKLEDIVPGKPYSLLKRLPIGIGSDDEYELRILKRGVDVNKVALWVDLYSSLFIGKGLASLVSSFESNDNLISIQADLRPVKMMLFDASAIRLSDQAAVIAAEKHGIALFSLPGREPLCLRECPIDNIMQMSSPGIDLKKARGAFATTGFPKVLMYVPSSTAVDIEVRQVSPWIRGKEMDLIILVGTWPSIWSWIAAEHLAYGGATDLITSFHISEQMMERKHDGGFVYSIDGSVLRFSCHGVVPFQSVPE